MLGTWSDTIWKWGDCPYRWDGVYIAQTPPDPRRLLVVAAARPRQIWMAQADRMVRG